MNPKTIAMGLFLLVLPLYTNENITLQLHEMLMIISGFVLIFTALPFGSEKLDKFDELDEAVRMSKLICDHLNIDKETLEAQLYGPELESIKVMAKAGDKIIAIKMYRELTDKSLSESKAYIESLITSAKQ